MLDYQEGYVISDSFKNSEPYLLSSEFLGILKSDARFGNGTSFARAMTIFPS